jgi:8-oxo-dGTP pyrophosphatase MutT (NUDIX family)
MKLPPQAKKVFSGQIFNVYQWEQAKYDGTTKTFEMLKRPDTVQVIATSGDRVYLSYEEQPMKPKTYTFLGGRIEPDEEPIDCAKRELKEESGMESDDWDLYKLYEFQGKIEWGMYLYIARDCRKTAEPHLDGGERVEVCEMSFDECMKIVTGEEFWGQNISGDWLRIQRHPKQLEEFKKRLFTNHLRSV